MNDGEKMEENKKNEEDEDKLIPLEDLVLIDVKDVDAESLSEYRGEWIAFESNSSSEDGIYMEVFVPEKGDLEKFANDMLDEWALMDDRAIYEDIVNQIKLVNELEKHKDENGHN
jgi:hypothetical protein